jgi:hypothetical protein
VIKFPVLKKETCDILIMVKSLLGRVHGWWVFNHARDIETENTCWNCIENRIKLELWVTSLSDTPHLQYYDVQTLEYRYISKLIISPSKFWTATIFLHAHLQVVYYICVKFHKNPIRCLGGVALTRYMPPPIFSWKYKLNYLSF